jgi:FOG: TPR repeat, SEL1 subfamily
MRFRSVVPALVLAAAGSLVVVPVASATAAPASSGSIDAPAAFQKAMMNKNMGHPNKANVWFHKAADLGSVDAQFMLGYNYANGSGGVQQDYAQAADWYRKAAQQGDVDAQIALGNLYQKGQGVPMDLSAAYELMAIAAPNNSEAVTSRDQLASQLTKKQREAADARVKAWTVGDPLP